MGSPYPHERSAAKAGLCHETLRLERGPEPKQWRHTAGGPWKDIERAALDAYRAQGWNGVAGEGGCILSVLKCMTWVRVPDEWRSAFLESWYLRAERFPYVELVTTTRERVAANFDRIATGRTVAGDEPAPWWYRDVTKDAVVAVHEILRNEGMLAFAEIFARDPYAYRAGWPDLTLWRNGELHLKEIKAPGDRLHTSQKRLAKDVLGPLGIRADIVDVLPSDPPF